MSKPSIGNYAQILVSGGGPVRWVDEDIGELYKIAAEMEHQAMVLIETARKLEAHRLEKNE